MAKISLTKSGLQKEKQQLQLYLKLLPSLNLKRNQLMTEHSHAKSEEINLNQEAEQILAEAIEKIPMLANKDVELSGLVKIKSVAIAEESIVGVKVPFLKEITFDVFDYSVLATPYWIEVYIKQLKKAVEAKLRIKLMAERREKLGKAVRRITQHINLFEKILIPNCKKNIQKIQIVLGDAERTAVVRSKLAKALNIQQRESESYEEISI